MKKFVGYLLLLLFVCSFFVSKYLIVKNIITKNSEKMELFLSCLIGTSLFMITASILFCIYKIIELTIKKLLGK
jgi:hypothetical protein